MLSLLCDVLPPGWLSTLGAILGGGLGLKVIELVAFRQNDGARMRSELWREIGALRQRCDQQDQKIARMQRRSHEVRKLVNVLNLTVLELMSEVNDHCKELNRPPKYDLKAESRRLRTAEGYKAGHDALDEDAADLETDDPEDSKGTDHHG